MVERPYLSHSSLLPFLYSLRLIFSIPSSCIILVIPKKEDEMAKKESVMVAFYEKGKVIFKTFQVLDISREELLGQPPLGLEPRVQSILIDFEKRYARYYQKEPRKWRIESIAFSREHDELKVMMQEIFPKP